jgi:hypothetical protein
MPAKPMDEPDWRKVDRAVQRAAAAISRAIDKMVVELPEGAAPQMAMAYLVRMLVPLQTQHMQWMMDDPYVREAYEASIAEIPATPGRTDF